MWKGSCKKHYTKSLTSLSNLKSHIRIFCPTWKDHAVSSNLNIQDARELIIIIKKRISNDTFILLFHYVVSAPPKSSSNLGGTPGAFWITYADYSYFVLNKKTELHWKDESHSFLSEARVHSICSFVRATSLLARAAHLAVTLRGARCV